MTKDTQLTTERLAEIILEKGLAAAVKEVESEREKLETEIERARANLEQAQRRLSILESVLTGAVKKSSRELGIQLDKSAIREQEPAPESSGKTRSRMTVEEIESARSAVLQALRKAGSQGLAIGGVEKVSGAKRATLRKWLSEWEDEGKIKKEGSKRDMRYIIA